MITLAIDTATKTAGVALLRDETLLVEYFFNLDVNHSETVLPAVHQGLARAGIDVDDVDLFALTLGPGSFTGLRIGASTVKGLAVATGKPVVGVSTLEALAYNAIGYTGLVCPLLDARKGEVYTALYRRNAEGFLDVVLEEQATTPRLFLSGIEGEILFLGDGLAVSGELIRQRFSQRAHFAPPNLQTIRASSVALLGRWRHGRGEQLDVISFVPRYLRRSEAEIRRAEKPGETR
ncbi:MAG TPA: tRNA (adenosine(37)-N6)-threonylcarbamoyltransferase complex dimerization subunit type 1 TsaB [Syntrophales bacterium]|nr:tRNA (adenosine(37)-N6)-threonylcarbamoyltransferase complex dimerization subunit type 1 TsaB [Syntrophales bacterium]